MGYGTESLLAVLKDGHTKHVRLLRSNIMEPVIRYINQYCIEVHLPLVLILDLAFLGIERSMNYWE